MEKELNERNSNNLLKIKDVRKSFKNNSVLKGIDMSIVKGDILSLIGGNGAGKSTLMKIIMGIYTADEGDIYFDNEKVNIKTPADALNKGIYMIPQEPLIFPNMTIEENVLIGIDGDADNLRKELKQILIDNKWNLDMSRKAMTLSISEQQIVEILRGILRHAKLLILDEPTSALTFDEVESLFGTLRNLQKQGVGMIYITHRLTEVFDLSTHVAIMKDGRITASGSIIDFHKSDLFRALLPDDDNAIFNYDNMEIESGGDPVDYSQKEVFELVDYSGYGFKDVSFKVYPGEILGLSGVVGAGRTELATTIFGFEKVLSGKAYLNGKDVTGMSTDQVLKNKINYVPEDRHLNGLFKMLDVSQNTTTSILDYKEMGNVILNKEYEDEISSGYVKSFKTKVTGLEDEVGNLSGGNQQKIVISRTLTTQPDFLILDEPTRGIDAGAREDVYNIIMELKKRGVAILLISSDLEEIVRLADRNISLYQGKINKEFSKEEINLNDIMTAAFGVDVAKESSYE